MTDRLEQPNGYKCQRKGDEQTHIYVMRLQEGKYYVGKSSDPNQRISEHFAGNGSAWTQKYSPLEVVELFPGDHGDENKHTEKYMEMYGIENVRGGAYVSVELDKNTTRHLKKAINGTYDRCFICSKPGHFAKHCNARNYKKITTVAKNNISSPETDRLGQPNGLEQTNGSEQSDKHGVVCSILEKIADFFDCFVVKDMKQTSVPSHVKGKGDAKNSSHRCSRCGRNTHMVDKCYATIHIKGYVI